MHFIAFVPEASFGLKQHPLEPWLSEAGAQIVQTPCGLNDSPGAFFLWGNSKGLKRLDAWQGMAAIEFTAELPASRYTVMIDKAAPPLPHEVQLAAQLPGTSVELGDGNKWTIPRLQDLDVEHPAYAVIAHVAHPEVQELSDALKQGRAPRVDIKALRGAVAQLLCENYRLSAEAIGLMKLLIEDRDVLRASLAMVVDEADTELLFPLLLSGG